MKKICNNCHLIYDSDDNFCFKCGSPLADDNSCQQSPQMQQQSSGTPIEIDNRIENHHGDKVTIGEVHHGDKTHIDTLRKSNDTTNITTTTNTTSNTTSNTTYNNTTIVQAKDEGSEMVECAYSGYQLPRRDTFRCKTCKRLIGIKYYIQEYNCCPDCADKLIAKNQIPAIQPSRPNTQMVTSKGPIISVSPNRSHAPYVDTSRAHNGSRSTGKIPKYILIGALLAAIYIGYTIFHDKGDNAESVAEQVKPSTESAPAPVQKSTEKKTVSAPSVGSKNNTVATTTSATAKKSEEPAKSATEVAKPDPTSKKVESTSAGTEAKAVQTQASKPAVTELSASELLSKGLSLAKKFQSEQALSYFKQAADKGSIEANYYIGDLYYNGNGVDKSFSTAKIYFEKAANKGMSDAQYMLGVMYRNGQGCDKNISTAKNWLQKAAAQGHEKAQQMLK